MEEAERHNSFQVRREKKHEVASIPSLFAEPPNDIGTLMSPLKSSLDTKEKRLNDSKVAGLHTSKEWQFPTNNQDNIEGDRHSFSDHILLSHLKDFPQVEQVLQFMELVIMGLEKNPYLSHSQKVRKIKWYRKYFGRLSLGTLI